MPAVDSNASNFLYTTDYPLDKIIYMKTGSFIVGAMDTVDHSIAHGLPFTPLLDGTWSTDPSFSLSYDMDTGVPTTAPEFIFDVVASTFASSTDSIVSAQNGTGSSVTVYYRIFGLEPSNSNLDVSFTSSVADNLVFNTDLNYTKLYKADIVTTTSVIDHGLGHRPQVNMWAEDPTGSGSIRKINQNDSTTTSVGYFSTVVSTINVTITFSPFAPVGTKAHYRIYLDN